MKSRVKKQKIGLIVGKFAPLHKGHQFLIETALKKVDQLIIIVYQTPKEIKIPLKNRVKWLKKLYPKAIIIAGNKAPLEHGKDPIITLHNIEFVKNSIPCPVTHVFSSEPYGQLLSKALGTKNILVDKKRLHFPISATIVRSDLEKYKKFLPDMVYQDLKKHQLT